MSKDSYTSEYFNAHKEHYKGVRSKCMSDRLEFLKNSDWDYELKPNGHVRVFAGDKRYDVWLSTGKWTEVGTNKYNQGWNQFVRVVEKNIIR